MPTAKLPALLVHLDEARDHFGRRGDEETSREGRCSPPCPRPPGLTFMSVLHELSRRDPPRGKVASLVPVNSLALFSARFSMVSVRRDGHVLETRLDFEAHDDLPMMHFAHGANH